eukprot:m.232396 g.232396  ORF g.232396 m.232396 type:complete len:57 (-) comp17373_c0_seq13:1799-1969(-)
MAVKPAVQDHDRVSKEVAEPLNTSSSPDTLHYGSKGRCNSLVSSSLLISSLFSLCD